MNMNIEPAVPAPRFNPVFWIMWLLPAATVVAGFVTLAIALDGADRPLPADYHWEGERLDQDFTRARNAVALGLASTLEVRGGRCVAVLHGAAVYPASLDLLLTHGSDAGLDRRVRLARMGEGEYRAACAPLEAGKWRVLLDDDSSRWSLRGSADGRFERLALRARTPDGTAP
jgi:hypothetical protein